MKSALASLVVMAALIAAEAQALPAATPTPVPRAKLLEVLAGLGSADPGVQAEAARAAGATHHPIMIDPLCALLAGGAAPVRVEAARALGELGIPPASSDLAALIASLLAAARQPDTALAVAAVEAVARYPFPEVRTRLAALSGTAAVPEVVRAAIRSRLAEPDLVESRARIDAWLLMARAEAEGVGLGVTLGAGELSPSARWGVPADDLVRHARDLLDPVGAPDRAAVAAALARSPAVDEALPFLERALSEPLPAARQRAVEGLARSTSARAEVLLLTATTDADAGVRAQVARALVARVEARSDLVSPLFVWLEREHVAEVRTPILAALARAPRPQVIEALTAARRPATDAAIRDGLAVLTATSAVVPLALSMRWMIDARDDVLAERLRASVIAGPDEPVVPVMVAELVRLSHDEERRARARAVLDQRTDPRIGAALIDVIARGVAYDGELALLRRQPQAEVRAPLLALAGSEDARVRAQVVTVARDWRGPDVVAALAAALAHTPADDLAFTVLLEQADPARDEALAAMLLDPAHARRRRGILATLAHTDDPRVAAAAGALVDGSPELAALVLPLLERQREAVAVPALARIGADPRVAAADRVRAIELVTQRAEHEAAVGHLLAVARDEELDVKMAARRGLHALDPAVFPEWDPYGRIPLVAVGAGFGASMLLLAHDIADAKLSPAFTAGAGLVLGAATPYLLTRGEEVSLGDAAYFASTATWGTLGGWGAGSAAGLDDQGTRWLTLAGQGLGLTVGALTMGSTEWSLGDALLANTTALEVAISAATLAALVDEGGGSSRDTAMIAGALAMAPMTVLARRLEVREDLGLLFASMGHGAWLGALLPAALGREGAVAEGIVIGQGAGYLTGLVLAHTLDADGGAILGSYVGSAVGAAALGGLALSLEGSSTQTRAVLVEVGSVAGLLAMGLFADRLELHENDGWLIALGGALGAVGGARLDVRMAAPSLDGEELAGNLLLGTSAGLLGGLVLSQLVDASDAQILRSLSGGAVLAAGGMGLGRALDVSPSARGLITGGAFVGGLLLTAPFAEALVVEPRTVGFASILGASLAGWSSQIPAWTEARPGAGQGFATGAVGASVGFAGGFALAQVLPVETVDLPLIAAGSLVGSLAGIGAGLWIPELGDRATVGLAQGLGLAGLTGASLLALSEDRGALAHGGRAFAPTVLFGAHGALLGGLFARARHSAAPAASEVGGGVWVGATLGATAGLLAAELGGLSLSSDVIAESTLMSGAAYAISGGLGAVGGDAQTTTILMESFGAAALVGSLLIAPHTDYDLGDRTLIGALGLLGAWHGGWAGAVEGDHRIAGGALLGGGLGVATGLALAPWLTPDPWDVIELGFVTEGAAALAGGVAWSLPDLSSSERALAVSLAGAGGLAAASLLVEHTDYSSADYGLIALTTALGAYQGSRSVPLWSPREPAFGAAGTVAGAGAGLLGGLALSQALEVEALDQLEVALMTAAAHTLTGGLDLALGDLSARDGALLGTTAGLGALAAGLWLAPYTDYSGSDVLLVGGGAALGAWHGFLLAPLAGATPDRAIGGAALAGAGAGLLGALALSQAVEVEPGDQAEIGLMTLAGDAVGAGLGWMLDDPTSRSSAALTAAVGLGALGGALWAAPHTQYGSSDYGLVGLGMGLGLWHGLWASAILGDNAQGTRAGGGALLGLGAGALVGTGLASLIDVSAGAQGEALAMWGYGSAIGGGLALTSGVRDTARAAVFVEAGGLAGLAGAAALGEHTSFSSGDALLIAALGVAGAWHGSTLPVLMGDPSAEARGGGALLGAGALALGGHLLTQAIDYDQGDVAEVTAAALVGNAMGFGLGLVVPGTDDRARMALIDGVGLGALGTMLVLAPHVDVDREVWTNALLLGGLGAGLGAALPATWSGPDVGETPGESVAGGALLGATLGLGASALLGDTLALDGDRRESIALGAFAGGLTGSGLGLALSEDDRWAAGLFEGLSLAGALAVGSTLDRVELSFGDAALGTTWTAYLAWHQLGITLLTGGTDRQAAGATLATVGLGTLTGTYLVPRLSLKGEQVLMLFAGSVWGSWIGGWSGAMIERQAQLEGSESAGLLLLASVLGSDLGVGLTSLILTEVLEVEPTRFAVINLCGLGGMMLGMLGAGFAQEEPLEAGNVIGSLAGLTLGTIVTSFFDFSDAPSPYEEVAQPAARSAPTALSISEWFPTARVEPTEDGRGERYLIGVVGRWD